MEFGGHSYLGRRKAKTYPHLTVSGCPNPAPFMSLPKQHPTRSFWLNQNPLANYRTTAELPTEGNCIQICQCLLIRSIVNRNTAQPMSSLSVWASQVPELYSLCHKPTRSFVLRCWKVGTSSRAIHAFIGNLS